MNNIVLIIALVVIALVILVLILRKSSAKKIPPAELVEDDISSPSRQEAEQVKPEIELEPVAETETTVVEEEIEAPVAEEAEPEEAVEEPEQPVVAEEETEITPKEEVVEEPAAEEVTEPEAAEEIEPQAEAVPELEEVEEPAETAVETEEIPAVEEEPELEAAEDAEPEVVEEEPVAEEAPVVPAAEISKETYEQQLMDLKEKQLAALTEAIENNEEGRRERLQVELVAITEALTFLNQSYDQEMACRNEARQALDQIQGELEPADYDKACASVSAGDMLAAEEVFADVSDKGSEFSALAAYQSGRLAECRIDFAKAMDRLEKAVTLDGENPEYLRTAALLARKLYKHKQALAWFTTLEQVLASQGEDTVELALARRELAYSSALVGQHKKAGGMYKQAMVSLSKLAGKDDPEMGICWLQIGKLQEALGQYEKAEDPYKKALAVMDKAGGNPALGEVLDKLAGLYMELEREMEAIPLFERLCAFKEDSPNPDNATLAITYSNLGEAYRICGKYDESEQQYMRALTLTEELRGKDHAAVGSVLQELAQLCDRQGKKEEAQAHRDRSAAIFQRVLEEQEAAGQEGVKFDL